MSFNKTGLSTVIDNVAPTLSEVKATTSEENCDCSIPVEKKEITTEE